MLRQTALCTPAFLGLEVRKEVVVYWQMRAHWRSVFSSRRPRFGQRPSGSPSGRSSLARSTSHLVRAAVNPLLRVRLAPPVRCVRRNPKWMTEKNGFGHRFGAKKHVVPRFLQLSVASSEGEHKQREGRACMHAYASCTCCSDLGRMTPNRCAAHTLWLTEGSHR